MIEKTNDCGWFVCRWSPLIGEVNWRDGQCDIAAWVLHTIHAKCATMDHAHGWATRHHNALRLKQDWVGTDVLWVCRTPFWSKRFILDWREHGELT